MEALNRNVGGGGVKVEENSSWILPEPRFEELVFSLSKKMFSSFQMVSFMNIFLSLSSFIPLNRQHKRGKQTEVLNKTSC